MTTRLALVDDDGLLRPILADNLRASGYEVTEFETCAQAMALDGMEFDLLILDWELPDGTGLDLLKHLRARNVAAPALFFTSHNDTLYEEAALSVGAVDFIDKTRSFAILSRRIALILERAAPAPPPPQPRGPTLVAVGLLTIQADIHEMRWRGVVVPLTYGEYRVMEYLVTAKRDVSYRELYDVLRGDDFQAGEGPDGYKANVRALIKRIRQKFIGIDPGFAAIGTFPGFGYRWEG